jgi:hypothetical protein
MMLVAITAEAPPAFIESWNGPDSAYLVIESNGQRIVPHHYGMPLADGYCVTFEGRDATSEMTIRTPDGYETVNASHREVCVHASRTANPVFVAIWQTLVSVADVFARAKDDWSAEPAVSRGQPGANAQLLMPLFRASNQRIAAGTRSLSLAWRNGRPPFRLQIFAASQTTPLAEVDGVQASTVTLKSIAFATGSYAIAITDNTGNTLREVFAVVPQTSLPSLPPEQSQAMQDASQPADLRAVVYAAWLFKQDPAWRLEAYQSVAPYIATSQAARVLAFELTGGA